MRNFIGPVFQQWSLDALICLLTVLARNMFLARFPSNDTFPLAEISINIIRQK